MKPKFYPSQKVVYEGKTAVVEGCWYEKVDENIVFYYEIEITARGRGRGHWGRISEEKLSER